MAATKLGSMEVNALPARLERHLLAGVWPIGLRSHDQCAVGPVAVRWLVVLADHGGGGSVADADGRPDISIHPIKKIVAKSCHYDVVV